MNNITIGTTYYDNYEAFKALVDHYKSWDDYKFIVVDDGSPKRPLEKNDVPANWSLYRVTEDIGFNSEGCRNLIVHQCETEWVCLHDVDYLLKDKDMDFSDHDKRNLYNFQDVEWRKRNAWKKKTDHAGRRYGLHNHNQICVTKKYFLEIGGYDETYAGYYGQDVSLFNASGCNRNVTEYEIFYNKNNNDVHIGRTPRDRKNSPEIILERHNRKLTFPWIKIQ